jgi:hypothetical protein
LFFRAASTHLREVLAVVPLERGRLVHDGGIDILETTVFFVVRREHDLVRAGYFDAHTIVGEGLGRMEVEDEQETRTLEHDQLVDLVLERDVSLWRGEPSMLFLQLVHVRIERGQVLIPQQFVVDHRPLAARMLERITIALAREVEPLWVTGFIALEVEISLSTEGVYKQAGECPLVLVIGGSRPSVMLTGSSCEEQGLGR